MSVSTGERGQAGLHASRGRGLVDAEAKNGNLDGRVRLEREGGLKCQLGGGGGGGGHDRLGGMSVGKQGEG